MPYLGDLKIRVATWTPVSSIHALFCHNQKHKVKTCSLYCENTREKFKETWIFEFRHFLNFLIS